MIKNYDLLKFNKDQNSFCIFLDIETTGLNVKEDKVIEIAAHLCLWNHITSKFVLISSFESLINREIEIDKKILNLTNIDINELFLAPRLVSVQEDWASWLEDWLLKLKIDEENVFIIGHSVEEFDLKIISREGFYLPNNYKTIDTNSLSKILLPKVKAVNLEYLNKYLELEDNETKLIFETSGTTGINVHRASYDSFINYKLFAYLINLIIDTNIHKSTLQNINKYVLKSFNLTCKDITLFDNLKTFDNKIKHSTNSNVFLEFGLAEKNIKFADLFIYLYNNNFKLIEDFLHYLTINKDYFTDDEFIAITQLHFISNFKYSTDDNLNFNIVINPYLSRVINICLINYLKFNNVYEELKNTITNNCNYNYIFENIIFEFDNISTIQIEFNTLFLQLRFIKLYLDGDKIIAFENSYNSLKLQFERNANFGVLKISENEFKTLGNMKLNLFIEAFISFKKHLFEILSDLTNLKLDQDNSKTNWLQKMSLIYLNQFYTKYNEVLFSDKIPYFKVNSSHIVLMYKNTEQFDLRRYFEQIIESKKTDLVSFLEPVEVKKIINILSLNLDEEMAIKYISDQNIDWLYSKIHLIEQIRDIDEIINILNSSQNSDTDDAIPSKQKIVVFNSYKLTKEFENLLSTYDKPFCIFEKNIFSTGYSGSITKGIGKMNNNDIDILFIKPKELVNCISNIQNELEIYMFGNIPINYAINWPYNVNITQVRSFVVKSNIKKILYQKHFRGKN